MSKSALSSVISPFSSPFSTSTIRLSGSFHGIVELRRRLSCFCLKKKMFLLELRAFFDYSIGLEKMADEA